jgi:hypothetical protein
MIEKSPIPTTPTGNLRLAYLTDEFSSGGAPTLDTRIGDGSANFTSTSLDFFFDSGWRDYSSTGGSQTGSAQGQGSVTVGSSDELFWNLPPFALGQPSRTYVGAVTPSNDYGVAIDVTPGAAYTGQLLTIRPSTSSQAFDCNYGFYGSGPSFTNTGTGIGTQRSDSASIAFFPRYGQTDVLGEVRSRTNDITTVLGQTQFRATANTTTGVGEGQVAFIGAIPVLGHLFSAKGRALNFSLRTIIQPTLIWTGVAE